MIPTSPKVLFCNVPFIEHRADGIYTGPNSGSCWPHVVKGIYSYVPFPFFMANATSYLQAHGIDATMFDAWAERITDYSTVIDRIVQHQPDILVLECATPLINQILTVAEEIYYKTKAKIVLTGSHIAAYGDELLELPYVDHVVAGEYDLACLKIAQGDTRRKIEHEYVADIDNIEGSNWLPYRDYRVLPNYLDPSMLAIPIQLQVNTSRGCSYKCSYCSWPATMYRRRHARKAENVLDEIHTVLKEIPHHGQKIGSIFFDDEMFNAGDPTRLETLARGLKDIGIPWTFMGRIDTSKREQLELFVDCGCVGMRFGVESFHQHLLDRVNKKLDVVKSREMCEWLLRRFSGIHVRLLTMKKLPGETEAEERSDDQSFKMLQQIGHTYGNLVTIQTADCVALPGTDLWKQLQAAGEGDKMTEFSQYNAHPDEGAPLQNKLDMYGITVKGKDAIK